MKTTRTKTIVRIIVITALFTWYLNNPQAQGEYVLDMKQLYVQQDMQEIDTRSCAMDSNGQWACVGVK